MSSNIAPERADELRAGVRDLRQRTAKLLDEVARGRTVTITRNNRPVARLVPVTPSGDPLDTLVSSGMAARPDDPHDLLEVVAAPPATGVLPSAALARLRDEERW